MVGDVKMKFHKWLEVRGIDSFEWEKIVVDEKKYNKILNEWIEFEKQWR